VTPAAAAPETRRLVTVLFSDVTGSTALGERLDPESLGRVMGSWSDAIRRVLHRHGGTVEKFIGDAVMAVFGMPLAHEDDALRAVRAAAELREAMEDLNRDLRRQWGVSLEIRTGVTTGEVLTAGSGPGDQLVWGDAVNLAARLEQAAGPGEVLLGHATWDLVRDAVECDPEASLALRGKEEPVSAWRLRSVRADAPGRARRMDAPLVGRERPLRLLRDLLDAASEDAVCWLATILGTAGIGKSRLLAEFVDRAEEDATVLQGRCVPYGEGITYRPIAEVIRQAAGLSQEDDPETARARLVAMLVGEEHAEVIAQRLADLLGPAAAGSSEEVPWAVRRFLETLSRRRPVIVVLDDLHWAEPNLLDLIEHLGEWSRDAPLLLVCLARPELIEEHPQWAGGMRHATVLTLEPLGVRDSERLAHQLLGTGALSDDARRRVVEVAEGNPLFLEELLAMLIADGTLVRSDGRWTASTDLAEVTVPTSISSLLLARLDQLGPEERGVLELASVAGQDFDRSAIAELGGARDGATLDACLSTLVRRDLIRSERASPAGPQTFRFRHVLIRDAAYQAVPKARRADLHEALARSLERTVGDPAGASRALLGHHLEQAYRCRIQLGPLDEAGRALGRAAAHALVGAAHDAWLADRRSAARLLQRALAVAPDDPARAQWLADVGSALLDTGDVSHGDAALREAAQLAATAEDVRLAWHVRLDCSLAALAHGRERRSTGELLEEAQRGVQALTEFGDDAGLARAWRIVSEIYSRRGRGSAVMDAVERSVAHARRAAEPHLMEAVPVRLRIPIVHGPTSVEDGLRRGRELLEEARGTLRWEAALLGMVGRLEARRGRFAEARALHGQSMRIVEDLGVIRNIAAAAAVGGEIEVLAGDLAAAERDYRSSYDLFHRIGNREYVTVVAAQLAEIVWRLGGHDEARALIEESEASALADHHAGQIAWRSAKARMLARHGIPDGAEPLARHAVRLGADGEMVEWHAAALLSLAEVLTGAGRPADARPCVEQAVEIYERKGDLVLAERARAGQGPLIG
jgi:class 3 adenylate cyclase/tetratricopeptide (TPR) repeat protein